MCLTCSLKTVYMDYVNSHGEYLGAHHSLQSSSTSYVHIHTNYSTRVLEISCRFGLPTFDLVLSGTDFASLTLAQVRGVTVIVISVCVCVCLLTEFFHNSYTAVIFKLGE